MLVAQSHANVKIVGSYSGLLIGAVGKTHLDIEDLAIMRAMPDLTVLAPADADRVAGHDGLGPGLRRPGLPSNRPRRRTRPVRRRLHLHARARSTGCATGGGSALISTGPQTGRVLAAAELLAESGIDASVIHVPSIKPIDASALVDAVAGADLVVTVEEHSVYGGLGGLVAEILTAAGPAPQIERIGVDDTWGESAGQRLHARQAWSFPGKDRGPGPSGLLRLATS